jgi:hypothetical protein
MENANILRKFIEKIFKGGEVYGKNVYFPYQSSHLLYKTRIS